MKIGVCWGGEGILQEIMLELHLEERGKVIWVIKCKTPRRGHSHMSHERMAPPNNVQALLVLRTWPIILLYIHVGVESGPYFIWLYQQSLVTWCLPCRRCSIHAYWTECCGLQFISQPPIDPLLGHLHQAGMGPWSCSFPSSVPSFLSALRLFLPSFPLPLKHGAIPWALRWCSVYPDYL